MRATIAGLASPAPLTETLPAMLRTDHFAQQLCASFDEVLAPVILSLDALPAYLDLSTTPEDMLPWLAQWLGMSVDPSQDMEIQRSLLRSASELHATRGTRRGIQLAVEAAIGAAVEVVETGATNWSATPGGELPGNPRPAILVVVRPAMGQEIDADRVEALVRSVKPAHIPHQVQVIAP
jgi:phage tail-like protein